MRYESIRSAIDALAYITDCNLATVSHMASLKRRPPGEFKRQIGIAQKAIDYMRFIERVDPLASPIKDTRVHDVAVCFNWNVSQYADSIIEKYN